MSSLGSSENLSQNLSHESLHPHFEAAKQAIISKIQNRGDLPHISVSEQLDLLEQLSEFELGKFLIERGGLNGFWTHYLVTHPQEGRGIEQNKENKPFTPLEDFLLNRAPMSLATQKRFSIFKEQIQAALSEGATLASIPSGKMGDLLDLDYSHLNSFKLLGVDLDSEALECAKAYAGEKGLIDKCQFLQRDAWDLAIEEEMDLIASNGLSIYEPSMEKVIVLYRQFYKALKSHGVLVTSFLTWPPSLGLPTGWRLDRINPQDALLQKILLVDILNPKFQGFRTEEETKSALETAGFKSVEIFYDQAHIFPTVVAKKISS